MITAMILLGVSTVVRLAFIVVRHFCEVHLLHEQAKVAAELAAAGVVQVKLGTGKTEVIAGTSSAGIAQ